MPIGELPALVPAFVQYVLSSLQGRGFHQYVSPRVHWEVNRRGAPHSRRWGVNWDSPENALLFYVFFK
eukprot:11456962-Alexandrium_andersonii.AAC.1